ncbi:MAG TPA: hypothetical protein VFS20_01890 [Longimicrobium sp.]|nr:hypothetical protein [Longimicrobium sp.]
MPAAQTGHHKDEILDRLARDANVAQFISFGPALDQRFAWVHGHEPNVRFATVEQAVEAILAAAPEGSVNVRSFQPFDAKSREFIYGLKDAGEVVAQLRRLGAGGLYTIVNETVDVNDGGVSGVAYGAVFEFAPGDTPRAVEKPGTAALERGMAMRAFETVYGFRPALPDRPELRVEFSIHPLRRGYRHDHTIVWEEEELPGGPGEAHTTWPNLFSRMLGDKAFGLLVAWLTGLPVPHATVFPRRLAAFSFGEPTGIAEPWLRTCPVEQMPGKFTTVRGWLDPYALMQREDPEGSAIASILAQRGVDARFSGALISHPDGSVRVEGVSGFGDTFMVGEAAPEPLPASVEADLHALYERAAAALGPVRFEWVHDGARAWIVQLHRGASVSQGRTIYPGDAERWHRLEVSRGIGALRDLIAEIDGGSDGVVLVGRVGVTSHFGDLLRRARIPSRIEDPGSG